MRDEVLVTVTDEEVVGLDVRSGEEAWDARPPLSTTDADVGAPIGLSTAGGRVVVLAEGGDLGVAPADGAVAWRRARAPLLPDTGNGTTVWVGTEDQLVVGRTGGSDAPDAGRLHLLATSGRDAGALTEQTDLGVLVSSLSSFAYEGGVAVLTEDGVTAYAEADLAPQWTLAEAAGARTLVTVAGGVVTLGPEGIRLFSS